MTRDGRDVYFVGDMRFEDEYHLNVVPVDGSPPAQRIETWRPTERTLLDFTPDGTHLLFSDTTRTLPITAWNQLCDVHALKVTASS